MTSEPSFMGNLMHRRVPHILGMYVAATWLVIELGDWVTERFNLPPAVTSYVFVGMLVLLPAVILFAYNHGAPGRDHWTNTEKIFIPLNILAAFGVLYLTSPQLNVEAATETVQIEDETGVIQEFEVPKHGYHKDIIGFFFKNETDQTDLDWLSYGLAMMLAHDMNRVSPVISVVTPFGSSVARTELTNKGFASFLDEPQGLQVQIARDRRSAALITGSFSQTGDQLTMKATVFDAETGERMGSHTASGSDWLNLVDEISFAMLEYLEVSPGVNRSNDPVSQHLSASLEAIKYFTNGHRDLEINNDYPAAIEDFKKAAEIDPGFAEAISDLSKVQYLSGDVESAKAAVPEALKNSYRLSESSKFVLKANRYVFDGKYDSAERVLDMWTEVQPQSTKAFSSLARLAKLRGGDEGLAKASAAYDRLLELNPRDYGVYRQKASVEQQRGDYDAAVRHLQTYLEKKPDSDDAHVQLASIYQAKGDLDAAQESLEKAAILSDNPMGSELGLARIEARRGLYDAAERRVMAQLSDELSPQQRLGVLSAQTEIAVVTGQLNKALALFDEIDEAAAALMPPMVRLVSIRNQRTTMLLMQGKPDEALALADEIIAQLQPPLTNYMNFTYTAIYEQTQNREGFREWAEKTQQAKDQLPGVFNPFLEMEAAKLAIWDEDFDKAVNHLDRAKELLDQSFLKSMQDSLGLSSVAVKLAELYLQANALEKGQAHLDGVLHVFPANGYAKFIQGKGYIAQGNKEAARLALNDALEIWVNADDNYVHLVEAKELLEDALNSDLRNAAWLDLDWSVIGPRLQVSRNRVSPVSVRFIP